MALTHLSLYFVVPYVYGGLLLAMMALATLVLKPKDWTNRFLAASFLSASMPLLLMPIYASTTDRAAALLLVRSMMAVTPFIPVFFSLMVLCFVHGEEKAIRSPLAALSLLAAVGAAIYIILAPIGGGYFEDGRYHFQTGDGVAAILIAFFVVFLIFPAITLFRVIPKIEKPRARLRGYLTISGYLGAAVLFMAANAVEAAIGDDYNPLFVLAIVIFSYITYYGFIIMKGDSQEPLADAIAEASAKGGDE